MPFLRTFFYFHHNSFAHFKFLFEILVSTFEKRSKKSRSQSPTAQTHQTTTTTSIENDISCSHPIANSVESDDEAVIGASSSTTTTSSSFLRDDGKLDPQRASNSSLNKDMEIDGGTVSDLMRYRVEQQRKGSISIVSSNQITTSSGGESKVSFLRKFITHVIYLHT